MKTDIHNQEYNELLARYLGGEMKEEEERAFQQEFRIPEEQRSNHELLMQHWKGLETYNGKRIPDSNQAWIKLHRRLENENLIPSAKEFIYKRQSRIFAKIAAVALILFIAGMVSWFRIFHKPAVEMVHLSTINEANTLIKTLSDGSVIYVAQNSLFSFPQKFERGPRNVKLQGMAYFDIASDPGNPFIIETGEAFIRVLGTAFHLKTENGNGMELIVERGKVSITLKNDPAHSQLAIAGEKISAMNNILVKSKQSDHAGTEWYKNRMHFKDETLKNIIHVLNLNFNAKFAVADKETGMRRLTVTFQNETPETMTELLCLTLHLKSQIINGAVVLTENQEGTRQH